MPGIRVVEEDRIRSLVAEDQALDAVRTAFQALAEGRVRQPQPMGLELPEVRGEVHVKGAAIQGEPVFGIKVASGFYDNPGRGLPTGSGLVLVFDAVTGFPLALLQDNGYLTELRTGAAGALATELLAPAEIERVAVIGAGVQARFQLRAVARVRRWRETAIWSRTREHAATCCQDVSDGIGIPCTPADSVEAAVAGADLVITVTPSRVPLVEASWLAPHATVVAVGSDGPEKRELAAGVLGGARVVADRLDQCVRLGEVHHAVDEGVLNADDVVELGAVLLGTAPGRQGAERVVCDLTGVGAQDAAMAGAVWTGLDTA